MPAVAERQPDALYCVVIPNGITSYDGQPTTVVYRPDGAIRTYRHGQVDGRAGITSYADTAAEAQALLAAGQPFALRTDVARTMYGWVRFADAP